MALVFTNMTRSLNVIPHTAAVFLGPTTSAGCYLPPFVFPHIINPSFERHLRCWRFLVCWMTIGFRKSRFSTSKMTILWNSIHPVPLLWNLVIEACGRKTRGTRDIEWGCMALYTKENRGGRLKGLWNSLEKEKRKCLKHEGRSQVWEWLAFVCSFLYLFKERELRLCWLRSEGHGERDWGWEERGQANGPGKRSTEERC